MNFKKKVIAPHGRGSRRKYFTGVISESVLEYEYELFPIQYDCFNEKKEEGVFGGDETGNS